ncbi:hypothetical protein LOK74_11150 [Brevibacillus humidisoli]|uniref:hypothetical protein n=1 Tax=Brevibacillus humidisoli TaxID=2895522 RepID=UPI001E4F9D4C|nr:hypothetical protein [Brevibacillus humidisoli]UFJ43005.1 hypothetical protein LOK74_11150 [Brevibacillus humidisoli]
MLFVVSCFVLVLQVAFVLSPAESVEMVENPIPVSSIDEAEQRLQDGGIVMFEPQVGKISELEEAGYLGLSIIQHDVQMEWLALAMFTDQTGYVPIYVYAKKDADVSRQTIQSAIAKGVINSKQKGKKSSEATKRMADNQWGRILRNGFDDQPQAKVLALWVMPDEKAAFWQTEYRVYKQDESSSKIDYYQLRADHTFEPEHAAYPNRILFGLKAQWWKQDANLDLLDPEPSDAAASKVSLSFGIMEDAREQADYPPVQIDLDFELDDDHVVWNLQNDCLLCDVNLPLHVGEFFFSHGVYIESEPQNDGFEMNVWYEGWSYPNFHFDEDPSWRIDHSVRYVDDDPDLQGGAQ